MVITKAVENWEKASCILPCSRKDTSKLENKRKKKTTHQVMEADA